MTSAPRPVRRALISVSDKTGLVPFATALAGYGIALISTVAVIFAPVLHRVLHRFHIEKNTE